MPLYEVVGVFQVALTSSQTVGLKEDRGGVVISRGLGGAEVGGDSKSLAPDPSVMVACIERLERYRIEKQAGRRRLYTEKRI